MRIMIDTNIIISAILFPNSTVAKVFEHLLDNHILVLSKYVIEEMEDVFNEKFPNKITEMNIFLDKISYEIVSFDDFNTKEYPEIRDMDDLPILANAINSNVDILITGDKDFDDITIEKPKIIKPRKYIDEYMQ